MEMRYWWLLNCEAQDIFAFHYHPGLENLGDYPSKHHTANVHRHVRPYYVQQDNSPSYLPRAMKPSSWRGCAEILGDPYSKNSPLPSIRQDSASLSIAHSTASMSPTHKMHWGRQAISNTLNRLTVQRCSKDTFAGYESLE